MFIALITGFTKTTSDIISRLIELDPLSYLVRNFLQDRKQLLLQTGPPWPYKRLKAI